MTESTGKEDLNNLITRLGSGSSPEKISEALMKEINNRNLYGEILSDGNLLIPKDDDGVLIVVQRL